MFFKKKKNAPKKQEEFQENWWEEYMSREDYTRIMESSDPRLPLYDPNAMQVSPATEEKVQSNIKVNAKPKPQVKEDDDNLLFELVMADMEKQEESEVSYQNQSHSIQKAATPSPVNENELKKALDELKNMVGIEEVKKMILEIVDDVKIRNKREAVGQYMPAQSLNMVFLGNPGTGKTTVAKIVGRIMKALGVVEKGHFVSATRDTLVVDYIGGTAKQTKKVLEDALGGILFIDEAYSLARGNQSDFGREAIDTIVEYMESNRGNILVILAGYEKEMESLWKINSGLKSRFPHIITFTDYSSAELVQLTTIQSKTYHVRLTKETESLLHDFYNRKQVKGRSDNGNGRLVRNELEAAIRRQSKRLKHKANPSKQDFLYLFPSDFAIKKEKTFNLEQELKQIVGNQEIKEHLQRLQANVKIQKMRKEQGLVTSGQSLHMIFTGNPGTGKTTIARLVGKILKELEVCKKGHVVEVGRSDLVGEYVGQTAPKLKDKVQQALGGILFIDEAYALARGGQNDFGKEAIDTLVQEMENHRDELIVILAGYTNEMNQFLKTNSGLHSRFPYVFEFKDYNVKELMELFIRMAKQDDYQIDKQAWGILRFLAQSAVEKNSKETGNGRYVRNCLEKVKQYQALRLANLDRMPTQTELRLLTEQDFFSILPFKKL